MENRVELKRTKNKKTINTQEEWINFYEKFFVFIMKKVIKDGMKTFWELNFLLFTIWSVMQHTGSQNKIHFNG